jgi:hypothetical protein
MSDGHADRNAFVFTAILFVAPGSFGQTAQDCRSSLDPKTFPPETCASILPYLSPADQLGSVYEDGTFVVFSPAPGGTKTAKIYTLPPPLRAEIALEAVSETMGVIAVADQTQHSDLAIFTQPYGRRPVLFGPAYCRHIAITVRERSTRICLISLRHARR